MRVVYITGILVLLIIAITIISVEGLITYKDACHATVVYDFCVPRKLQRIDDATTPIDILHEIQDVNHNTPYLYRQAFVLSLLQSLVMTNFLYAGIPLFRLRHFFFLFFMCFLFNSFIYAFVNFHYYDQKRRIIQHGIDRLEGMCPP